MNINFLESGEIRCNVVTRAKLLGYVPRSILAPRATVDISVDTTGESQIANSLTLPRGAKLKTNVSGDSFNYVVLSDTSVTHDATNNRYLFPDVQIAQGVYKSMAYRVDNDIENQKFQLGDKDADVSTLRVRLQQNEEAVSFDIYTPFSTLLNLDSTSQIYYTQENPSELFEVYFGDGIIGKKPVNNNIVTLDYVHTQGPESNGAGGAINSTTGFNMIDTVSYTHLTLPTSDLV